MMSYPQIVFLLAGFFLIAGLIGCVQVPLDVKEYVPQIKNAKIVPAPLSNIEAFEVIDSDEFNVVASLYEYNGVLALALAITNKTSEEILPKDYSIRLADGRDCKKIKMLTREEMMQIRARYGGSKNYNMQDQFIEATMSNAMRAINVPTKEKLGAIADVGISNYFAFRPIYAKEKRFGVICFIPEFKLEFPLTLFVEINGREIRAPFLLKNKGSN